MSARSGRLKEERFMLYDSCYIVVLSVAYVGVNAKVP